MIRVLRLSTRALMLAGAVGLAACGGDGGGGGGGGGGGNTSTFTGIVSADDGSQSGSITLVVQTANLAPPAPTALSVRPPVNVTGTLEFGGTIALTGLYDPDTDAIAAAGGGFSFGGGFDGSNRLEGNWDNGAGGLTGNFVTALSASAITYCGTYVSDDLSDSGTFSFVVAGSLLIGEAVSDQGAGTTALDGSVSGNNITIVVSGGPGTAAGVIAGANVSGTFDDQGFTGTWSGSVCP